MFLKKIRANPTFENVCTQKSTPSQSDSEKECLEGVLPMFFSGSIQLRAGRDVVVHHKKMEFLLITVLLVIYSRQQHTA